LSVLLVFLLVLVLVLVDSLYQHPSASPIVHLQQTHAYIKNFCNELWYTLKKHEIIKKFHVVVIPRLGYVKTPCLASFQINVMAFNMFKFNFCLTFSGTFSKSQLTSLILKNENISS
jgi:hypothetical protein